MGEKSPPIWDFFPKNPSKLKKLSIEGGGFPPSHPWLRHWHVHMRVLKFICEIYSWKFDKNFASSHVKANNLLTFQILFSYIFLLSHCWTLSHRNSTNISEKGGKIVEIFLCTVYFNAAVRILNFCSILSPQDAFCLSISSNVRKMVIFVKHIYAQTCPVFIILKFLILPISKLSKKISNLP